MRAGTNYTHPNFNDWLLNYKKSFLYECEDRELSCEPYHVLAPIFHDIGFFASYKLYSKIIGHFLQHYSIGKASKAILVAGADSEYSVKSFVDIVKLHDKDYLIEIFDKCQTPLKRIQNLYNNEEDKITCNQSDILKEDTWNFRDSYELIICDSFVRQFKVHDKEQMLLNLAKIGGEHCLIVFREHIGDAVKDLKRFYEKLKMLYAATNLNKELSMDAQKIFWTLVADTSHFMHNVGENYSTNQSFVGQLEHLGFSIVHFESLTENVPNPCVIVAAYFNKQ